jgi:methionyl-tRNA formyltransferase
VATTSGWLTEVRRQLWEQECFSFIPDRRLPEPYGEPERGGGPRAVFAGFPSDYSLAFLLALLELDVQLAGIVTSPGAHPAILGSNALSQIADHLAIPLLRCWRVNEEHCRLDLAALHPDLGVMASFDQILGARVLAIPVHGWLNVHPSALPAYRGPEPVYWTIADGAEEAGITLHRAVPRFDAGPVLAQRRARLTGEETAGTLTRRLCALGTEVLGDAVAALLADDPGSLPDPSAGSYRPSVGHRRLDTAGSALEAERMVRAGVPNMPAWTEVDGRAVYVTRADRVDGCGAAAGLRYADGCLRLLETAVACGCHHDQPDCPHREPPARPQADAPPEPPAQPG